VNVAVLDFVVRLPAASTAVATISYLPADSFLLPIRPENASWLAPLTPERRSAPFFLSTVRCLRFVTSSITSVTRAGSDSV
jgi:hypothetical protein